MSLERIKIKLESMGSSIEEGATKVGETLKGEYKLGRLNIKRNRPTSVILREAIVPNPAPPRVSLIEVPPHLATPIYSLRQPYISGWKNTADTVEAKIKDDKISGNEKTFVYNTESISYYDVIGRNPLAFANVFHYPNVVISTAQAGSLACCNTMEDGCSKFSAAFCSTLCPDAFSTFCSKLCCVNSCSEDKSKQTERDSCWLAAGGKCFVACLCCSAKSSATVVSHTLGALTDNYIIHPIYNNTCAPELQRMDDNTSMRINQALPGLTTAQMKNLMATRGYQWGLHHRAPTHPKIPRNMTASRAAEPHSSANGLNEHKYAISPMPGAIPSPPLHSPPRSSIHLNHGEQLRLTTLADMIDDSRTPTRAPSRRPSYDDHGLTIIPYTQQDAGATLHFPVTPNPNVPPLPLGTLRELTVQSQPVYFPGPPESTSSIRFHSSPTPPADSKGRPLVQHPNHSTPKTQELTNNLTRSSSLITALKRISSTPVVPLASTTTGNPNMADNNIERVSRSSATMFARRPAPSTATVDVFPLTSTTKEAPTASSTANDTSTTSGVRPASV